MKETETVHLATVYCAVYVLGAMRKFKGLVQFSVVNVLYLPVG